MLYVKPLIILFAGGALALPHQEPKCSSNAECLKRGLPLRAPHWAKARALSRRGDNLRGTYSPTANQSAITIVANTAATYSFTLLGGSGGPGFQGATGGFGAQVVRLLSISAGDSVTLVPGAQGLQTSTAISSGGGGGASWLYVNGVLQVVAGGGGGGGDSPPPATTPGSLWIGGNGISASLTEAGTQDGAAYVSASTGGSGGQSTGPDGSGAGGGGGFYSADQGQRGTYSGDGGAGPVGGFLGGKGVPNGGMGGYGGGGGGGYFTGGGGGGYSGGAGGTAHYFGQNADNLNIYTYSGGGGGGSFGGAASLLTASGDGKIVVAPQAEP